MVFIEFASVFEFVSFADTFKNEYGESISQRKLSRKVVLRHGDATIPSSSYDPTALEVLCLLKHTRRNCHSGLLQSFSKWPAANFALIAHDFCLSRTHADNKIVAPLSGASFSVRFFRRQEKPYMWENYWSSTTNLHNSWIRQMYHCSVIYVFGQGAWRFQSTASAESGGCAAW